jgi:hypothetical protein
MPSLVFAALMLFVLQPHDDLFPLPSMHENWPSAGLTTHEQSLLQKAHGTHGSCEFDYALVDLGKLGKGVLTRNGNGCSCGAREIVRLGYMSGTAIDIAKYHSNPTAPQGGRGAL